MQNNTSPLPEWEQVLSAAAHLQRIFPDAVLVGGTAAALYAGHRVSTDADHVLTDLRVRFDKVLAELESVAGWKTARVRPPVQILGSLDGIETGVRQLIRETPLETAEMQVGSYRITLPNRRQEWQSSNRQHVGRGGRQTDKRYWKRERHRPKYKSPIFAGRG
jgi:hypothetical protein